MRYSSYLAQLKFFNANVNKTKSKPTIVAMANSLITLFHHKDSVTDIKKTLSDIIELLDLINHENYSDYMLPKWAICLNLVKKFDKEFTVSSKQSDMIINTISVVSYFFYKPSRLKRLVSYNEHYGVYLVEYPIPSSVDFHYICNYWHGEQGKMRVDYIKWISRHFKLILKELENSTQT